MLPKKITLDHFAIRIHMQRFGGCALHCWFDPRGAECLNNMSFQASGVLSHIIGFVWI